MPLMAGYTYPPAGCGKLVRRRTPLSFRAMKRPEDNFSFPMPPRLAALHNQPVRPRAFQALGQGYRGNYRHDNDPSFLQRGNERTRAACTGGNHGHLFADADVHDVLNKGRDQE